MVALVVVNFQLIMIVPLVATVTVTPPLTTSITPGMLRRTGMLVITSLTPTSQSPARIISGLAPVAAEASAIVKAINALSFIVALVQISL